MYKVSIHKKFRAQHFLPHEQGKEHTPHYHDYQIEITLSGGKLDEHGFLVDIIVIKKLFTTILENFTEKLLNMLPDFQQKNPSLENFSRIVWEKFTRQLDAPNIQSVEVIIWENDQNWASFTGDITQ